jgi:hypothetical protein
VSLALAEARVARPAMSCVRICFVEGGEYGMLTEGEKNGGSELHGVRVLGSVVARYIDSG